MSNKKHTQARGVITLLLAALVWGISFVAQSEGMRIGGFTFNGLRLMLGGVALLPVIRIMDRRRERTESCQASNREIHQKSPSTAEPDLPQPERQKIWKESQPETRTKNGRKPMFDALTLRSGIILGVILTIATNVQQFAFVESSSGKIAFITATYMFFVPFIGLPLGKRVSHRVWLCVALGFVGMFFLCMDPRDLSTVNGGDVLALMGAVMFSIHILTSEKLAPKVDGIKLSCIQFLTAGTITTILMLIFEEPSWTAIVGAAIPLLYSGLLSCDVGYTFQIIGQQQVEATIASLLMSLESVFAVLASALLLGERMLGREIIGCIIMFVAIVLSQVADLGKGKKEAE